MSKQKCRTQVLYYSPQTSNGKIVSTELTEVGFREKIDVKAGQNVLINGKEYNGKFQVVDVHFPDDVDGGTMLIKAPYRNTGERDTQNQNLLIDTKTGGMISVCENDMSSGKINPQADQKSARKEESAETAVEEEPKKKKINWVLVIVAVAIIIGLIWYFNRKKQSNENAVPEM